MVDAGEDGGLQAEPAVEGRQDAVGLQPGDGQPAGVAVGPAWGKPLTKGSDPEVERDIRGAVQDSIPYVLMIWAMVVLAAVLGVIKHGTTTYWMRPPPGCRALP